MIKQVFWNPAERRIRSFWRLLITGLVSVIVVAACSIVTHLVLGLILDFESRPLISMLVGAPVTLASLLVCVAICGRFLDRRRLSGFGLRIDQRWLKDLAFGLALGFVLVTGIVAIEFITGWIYQVDPVSRLSPEESRTFELATLIVFFICVGIYEELVFRGYMLKNLAEGWNWRFVGSKNAVVGAVVATSLLFGIIHGLNPNASAISVANTVLSGLLLSLGLMLTSELAIPIGYHITWNLTQSVVYGLPVSGMSLGGGLLALQNSGPDWLTGGDYGPEGGLLCTAALLLGMLVTAVWVRLNKRPLCIDRRLAETPAKPIARDKNATERGEQTTGEVNESSIQSPTEWW